MAMDSIFWLVIAAALVVLEANTVSLVCIWFAVGAVAALLTSLVFDHWLVQSIVFVAVSILALLCTRPLVKKMRQRRIEPTNADRNIGRNATVLEPIVPGKTGRVRLDGVDWAARGRGEAILEAGQQCRVFDMQSTVLIVEPQPEHSTASV